MGNFIPNCSCELSRNDIEELIQVMDQNSEEEQARIKRLKIELGNDQE
jgi:hypothetical protein